MFPEVSHGFAHRFPPLTVVTTNGPCAGILDLTTEAGRQAAGTDLPTLGCASHAGPGRGARAAHMDAGEAAHCGGGGRGGGAELCDRCEGDAELGAGAEKSSGWWRGMRRGGWGEFVERFPEPHLELASRDSYLPTGQMQSMFNS